MGEPICDFCTASPAPHLFEIKPFVVVAYAADEQGVTGPFPAQAFAGDWAACTACRDLIEADEREALLDRAMETSPIVLLVPPEERPQIRFALLQLHDEFFRGLREEPR